MKNIMLALLALALYVPAKAQVKLNLQYQPDTKVYTVSVIPDITWGAPNNMLASAQIVLKVPSGNDFTPAITSLIPGLVWADNAYVENPAGAPGATFVCVALVNGPTNKIMLAEGQEQPLFSFVNAGGGCVGTLELLRNDDLLVQAVRAGGLNVTQHFAFLGARGNGQVGIVNGSIDCSPATGVNEPSEKVIDEVKISPVPADEVVTVQWLQLSDGDQYRQMIICDAQGREVFRDKVSTGKGAHSLSLNVANWKAGLYRVRFASDDQHLSQAWNLLVVH